jgi:hypothetical protein
MALFPQLTQATSSTPRDQPCYVPFASRVDKNSARLYVVNTPDAKTGTSTTETDVLAACQQRKLPGLLGVTRCNSNIFTATFNSSSNALMARNSVGISLPSNTTSGPGTVTISAAFHFSWAPRVFSCDVVALNIDHNSVVKHISEALRGRDQSACYELLQQETAELYDDRMRYLLRFKKGTRTPWVQQFHIPVQLENGGGKIWATFRPENLQMECQFCGAACQAGNSSACHFTRVIASQACR